MNIKVQSSNPSNSSLSNRGQDLQAGGGLIEKWKWILDNPYDPDTNPDGVVNLGVAENYLMLDEPAKFANQHLRLEAEDFSYRIGPFGGSRLRKAMASHMTRYFHPLQPFDPDNFVFTNGVTALCEMLGFSLFDEGDTILLSRPIYQAFKGDFGTKAKVKCHFVPFGDKDQFSTEAIENYEQAIQECQHNGVSVRALLLCHPHNPLGRCYTPEALIGYMKLCSKYKIHLLVDEIYALSVFDVPDPKATKFRSVWAFDTDKYIDANYIHLIYGMSKDTAAGGIRSGCLYTRNANLRQALSSMSMFHWSGNITEKVTTAMLEDEKWMDEFLQSSRAKLGHRNLLVRKMLDDKGIKYYPGANAGFFLWLDLRAFLPKSAPDSEDSEGWDREEALTQRLVENKVYITSGQILSSEEPGWYRFIFSQEERVVHEGFQRIVKALGL